MTRSDTTRRGVLAACGAGLAAGLAGCSGGGGDQASTTAGPGDGGSTPGDGDGGTSGRTFAETVRFPESFAMETTVETEAGSREMSGRFDDGNVYWRFEQDGEVTELYLVDGTSYTVAAGQCLKGSTTGAPETTDPSEFETGGDDAPALEPTGTDTIDGDEVLVYEIPSDAEVGPATYYVLPDSGYPRRIERDGSRWDFHSWNEVDPVTAPDRDCREFSQGSA